ncbi:MAG: ArsR family transcriptional regulator [Proteobacteria bacterium]|nr:ArsR family transcriptional regulator [Pseudomonadota bacterium]
MVEMTNVTSHFSKVLRKPTAIDLRAKFSLLADTFKTLGDYSRVRIVWTLVQSEKCPTEIAEAVGLSPSAVSHHLKVLREANLVRMRREHRQIFYALDDEHINELIEAGIEHVEEILQ